MTGYNGMYTSQCHKDTVKKLLFNGYYWRPL
jgi:hypothetical protein